MPRLDDLDIRYHEFCRLLLFSKDNSITTAEQVFSLSWKELVSCIQASPLYENRIILKQDIDQFIEATAKCCMAKRTTAFHLLNPIQMCLSTGSLRMDEFLNGGICMGQILELVGHSGSGKTQICASLAAVTGINRQNVVYFTCSPSAVSRRITEMVKKRLILGYPSSRPFSSFTQDNKTSLNEILQRIVFCKATNLHTVMSTFDDITHDLENDNSVSFSKNLQLIIIDPITKILGAAPNADFVDIGMMESFLRSLKWIAKQKNIAIIFTNGVVYQPGNNKPKPALGKYWQCGIDTQIQVALASGRNLERNEFVQRSEQGGNLYIMEVTKSPKINQGSNDHILHFAITPSGVE